MPSPRSFLAVLSFATAVGFPTAIGQQPRLEIRQGADATSLRLRLIQEPSAALLGTRYRFDLHRSADLRNWEPAGIVPPPAGTDLLREADVDTTSMEKPFLRVQAVLESTGETDPALAVGLGERFRKELARIGEIPPEGFARAATSKTFQERITFDPTTARFWEEFNTDPQVYNASLPTNSLDRRLHDFRLNPEEAALFRTNGFVVSERLGSYSFADLYYRIYADDLPVFVTADSILHAWHFSFQKLLEELEETCLAPRLERNLDALATSLVDQGLPNNPAYVDADLYLTIARSLMKGVPVAPRYAPAQEVQGLLASIQGRALASVNLFGRNRLMDFSQFIPRGHYTRSPLLSRYFEAYTWLSLCEFRLVEPEDSPQSLRELAAALTVAQRSPEGFSFATDLQLMDRLVGPPNNLDLTSLWAVASSAGLGGPPYSSNSLRNLQQRLRSGVIRPPGITASPFVVSAGTNALQTPGTFSLVSKRFTLDGWLQTQVTFPRIRWSGQMPSAGFLFGDLVVRKWPSAADIAFGVFANDGLVPWISDRLLINPNGGVPFRDGLPYHHNLLAARATLDLLSTNSWNYSLYSRWLHSLRGITEGVQDARLPQAMKTRAWTMKDANTQAASWAQLRHDTVLYAAEPYSGIILCEYPAGFVEPRLALWSRLETMARETGDALAQLGRMSGYYLAPNGAVVDLQARHQARRDFLLGFATTVARLRVLSEKELAQTPFDTADVDFIRSLMNISTQPYFGKRYSGWYPALFYKDYGQTLPESGGFFGQAGSDNNGSDRRDHLVVGVHTAPTDAYSVGGVLHEGVGDVDLMMVAVDNGPDRMVYAGPTMRHYEWIEPGPSLNRLSDDQWSLRILSGSRPSRPDWTRSYLVPSR